MKFKDYEFGYADASKEYTLVPKIFEEAFYDSKEIVNKLINDWKFILIGRKGVGKSAFSAKIQSLSDNDEKLITFPMKLDDFEFSVFSKTNIDNDVVGTKKYKDSWQFILLLTIYKIIYVDMNIKELEELEDIIILLKNLGFPVELNYKKNILALSKLKMGANAGIFDIAFEKEFGEKPKSYLERVSMINEKMMDTLLIPWFNDQKVLILIDGVDDILRYKKNQLEILSSLIRSVDYLNLRFVIKRIPIKIVLFIREDIVCSITDPDINKIKRDGAITLSWANSLDDLKSIVNLRFKFSGVPSENVSSWWDIIFPRVIKDKKSWDYMLEHTLYKPRDVLQFLVCCQENFAEKGSLTFGEMQTALKIYSRDYFIEEMKNEITGSIEDDLINILPAVFRKIAKKSFKYIELLQIINEQSTKKVYDDKEIKNLLLLLFEAGYMGQLVATGNNSYSVVFKYRNTTANIDYSQRFITHQGLHRGLGVRI